MKHFTTLSLVLLFTASPLLMNAQDCDIYQEFREGTTTKMVHYDQKDKITGITTTTIKEKNNLPNGVSVRVHQLFDDTEEYTFESEFTMECRDGVTTVDMEKFIDPNSLSAYENMEIEVEADNIPLPSNAKPGDALEGGLVTVRINTGTPVKVTMTVEITNRKVESREKVETPAGTFDCLKITYDMLSKIGFVKIQGSTAEYYNSKVGVVRSESFNKKGKLTGYTVLEEINN
jgi:hypothetical protein